MNCLLLHPDPASNVPGMRRWRSRRLLGPYLQPGVWLRTMVQAKCEMVLFVSVWWLFVPCGYYGYDDMFWFSICIPDSAGDVECTFVDPCVLLWHLCRNSESFSDFMEAEMTRIPTSQSQPWSVVLYSDEVSPGNSLKPDNRRNSCTETPVCFLVLLVCFLGVWCDMMWLEL